jgi:hypothetical protein
LAESENSMTGTPNQIEWAEQIRPRVAAEFDRVAKAFGEVAERQGEAARAGTLSILEILQDKRAEVMARREAGYFIRDWQELAGKVRTLIAADPRYRAMKGMGD